MFSPTFDINFTTIMSGIFGFVIKEVFTHVKERRKDIKDRVGKIETKIEAAASRGVTYWTSPFDSEDAKRSASDIKGARPDISAELSAISDKQLNFEGNLISCQSAFFQALTDGNFETFGRPEEHGRILRIQSAKMNFISVIRLRYGVV